MCPNNASHKLDVEYVSVRYTYGAVLTGTPPLFQPPAKRGPSPRITIFVPSSNLNLLDNIAWKTTVRVF